jgi:hypothetical protein
MWCVPHASLLFAFVLLFLLFLVFWCCDHVKTNLQLFSRAMVEATLCYSVDSSATISFVSVRYVDDAMFAHPVNHPRACTHLCACSCIHGTASAYRRPTTISTTNARSLPSRFSDCLEVELQEARADVPANPCAQTLSQTETSLMLPIALLEDASSWIAHPITQFFFSSYQVK